MNRIKGLDKVLKNLNKHIRGIEDRSVEGLLAAGLILQRDSQEHVPVEHGFLRASAYTRKSPLSKRVVEVGFSSKYAIYVHENLEEKLRGKPRQSGLGHYWGPKGESQFLLKSIGRKEKEMLKTIQQMARVKK